MQRTNYGLGKRAVAFFLMLFIVFSCEKEAEIDKTILNGFWKEAPRELGLGEDLLPWLLPLRCLYFEGDSLESFYGFKSQKWPLQSGMDKDAPLRLPYSLRGKGLQIVMKAGENPVSLGNLELYGKGSLRIWLDDSTGVSFNRISPPQALFNLGDTLIYRLLKDWRLTSKTLMYRGAGQFVIVEEEKITTGKLKPVYLKMLKRRADLAFAVDLEDVYDNGVYDVRTNFLLWRGNNKPMRMVSDRGRAGPDELHWLQDFLYLIDLNRETWLDEVQTQSHYDYFGRSWSLEGDRKYELNAEALFFLREWMYAGKLTETEFESKWKAKLIGPLVLADGTRRWPAKGTLSRVETDGRYWKLFRWECPDSTFDLGFDALQRLKQYELLRPIIEFRVPVPTD